jgi:cytochrome c-type biogenesis protein CcmH/NrfG
MDLGTPEEARRHLAEAVRLEPGDPKALGCLALLLSAEGELDQAVVHFRRALELDPDLLVALLELASIRATSDDASLRDGKEAIELATRACRLTGYQDPAPLAVLAQAYAEVGRFPDAASTAERAIRAAEAAGNQRLATAIREALESYQRHQPLRPSPR